MEIKQGRFYKTTGGFKAEVFKVHSSNAIFVAFGAIDEPGSFPIPMSWGESGKCSRGETFGSLYDLVSECEEPLDFDWDCLPEWMNKYIAMDSDGAWYAYNTIPTTRQISWISETQGKGVHIPTMFIPKNFTGEWKDSVFMNPKHEPAPVIDTEDMPQEIEWEQFDADRWNDNIPVRTIDGQKVRILCTDAEDQKTCNGIAFPIVGIIYQGGVEQWKKDGRASMSAATHLDLMMQKSPSSK